jgi:hypothetical protein
MTRQDFNTKWCQLSERYMKSLDNPVRLGIIRKQLDTLWAKVSRLED